MLNSFISWIKMLPREVGLTESDPYLNSVHFHDIVIKLLLLLLFYENWFVVLASEEEEEG